MSINVDDRLFRMDPSGFEAVGALSALDDPVRRRLYTYIVGRGERVERVGRDEAATGVGISRTLAAYHLDKLAAEGLLTVAYERRSGRTGPGAGRPAKLYARSDRELTVSVPPRDYGVPALLLAEAVASDTGGATGRALREAAARLGRQLAREASGPPADVEEILRARGYEPYHDADGVLRLHNCPFHAAAQRHPDVVCAMNLALLQGLLAGLGADDQQAVLEPAPGRCCVALGHDRRRPSEP
jgi:predicted ArsR family transcriptional regulator